MKKIITIFRRGDDHLVINEITDSAKFIESSRAIPTRKYDGTACMIKDGKLYKRYEAVDGNVPDGFILAGEDNDKQQGWVPVGEGPEDQWHREAWQSSLKDGKTQLADGTYELCGPKVQGNPEKLTAHTLIPHGKTILENVPRDYNGLKAYLTLQDIEGIVFWHPDGRLAKIKKKDYGLKR